MEVRVTLKQYDFVYLESLFLEQENHGIVVGNGTFEEFVDTFVRDQLFDYGNYQEEAELYLIENKDAILSRHPEVATDEDFDCLHHLGNDDDNYYRYLKRKEYQSSSDENYRKSIEQRKSNPINE